MLSQKNRFHGHNSLSYLYRNGKSARSAQLTIKYIHNPRRKNSRYTVVVGKKVLKSAVKRNIIRRRIYEIIRLELPILRDSHDVAVMVFSSEVLSISHPELKVLVKTLLSQAGLYK